MVIAFANAKGGTGKSTLLLLLANFLCTKDKKVIIIETQQNGSLGLLSDRSRILEHRLPFEYFSSDLARSALLISRLGEEKDNLILIELPSQGYDEKIMPLLLSSALIICPFCYDGPTLMSTIYFACFARRIKEKIPLLFLPNRIPAKAAYEFKEETDQVLRQIAPVSPGISEHVGFQRVSSMKMDKPLLKKCSAALELIYTNYLQLQNAAER